CCRPIPAPWFIVLRASLNIKHAPDIPGAQSAGCSTEAEGKPPKAYTFRITPDHPNQIDKSGHILSLNPHLGPCCRTSGLISLENSARVVFSGLIMTAWLGQRKCVSMDTASPSPPVGTRGPSTSWTWQPALSTAGPNQVGKRSWATSPVVPAAWASSPTVTCSS